MFQTSFTISSKSFFCTCCLWISFCRLPPHRPALQLFLELLLRGGTPRLLCIPTWGAEPVQGMTAPMQHEHLLSIAFLMFHIISLGFCSEWRGEQWTAKSCAQCQTSFSRASVHGCAELLQRSTAGEKKPTTTRCNEKGQNEGELRWPAVCAGEGLQRERLRAAFCPK